MEKGEKEKEEAKWLNAYYCWVLALQGVGTSHALRVLFYCWMNDRQFFGTLPLLSPTENLVYECMYGTCYVT